MFMNHALIPTTFSLLITPVLLNIQMFGENGSQYLEMSDIGFGQPYFTYKRLEFQ